MMRKLFILALLVLCLLPTQAQAQVSDLTYYTVRVEQPVVTLEELTDLGFGVAVEKMTEHDPNPIIIKISMQNVSNEETFFQGMPMAIYLSDGEFSNFPNHLYSKMINSATWNHFKAGEIKDIYVVFMFVPTTFDLEHAYLTDWTETLYIPLYAP